MEFMAYWPVQRDPVTKQKMNICAPSKLTNEGVYYTHCGDSTYVDSNNPSNILKVVNPDFDDDVGAPTDFGDTQVCKLPSVLADGSVDDDGEDLETAISPNEDDSEGLEATISPDGDSEEDENTCFPASAMVKLEDGAWKRMEEVQIGDKVQVGSDKYSPVFMFTHRDADVNYLFVELETSTGERVRLTKGHYIYVNGRLEMAGTVRLRDEVIHEDGTRRRISNIRRVWGRGLFNPQTMHGDIVVDGLVASTYTRSVSPKVAHGLLAPLRCMYAVSLMYEEKKVLNIGN